MKNLVNTKAMIKGLCPLIIAFFANFSPCFAQANLVPNPSFEEYISCPSSFFSPPPTHWYMPTNYGLSYANNCSISLNWGVPYNSNGLNYQNAKTGVAYIAIFCINQPGADMRNYFQVKLNDSLKNGKWYYTEFYVAATNDRKLKCNNVSMLLTKTAVYVDTINFPYGVLPANAQIYNYGNPIINDTMNWVKVSSIYKAQGGEQYLSLGNFKDDANTSYITSQPNGYDGAGIMIDDVSVIPLDSFCLKASAGKDTAISLGDSVFIGSYINGIDSLKWLNGNTVIDSLRPGFWVKPTTTTTYILQQTVNGCFSADTVVVNVGTVPLKIINYKLLMINEKQVLNEWTTTNEINVSHFNIQRSINGKDFITIGQVKANNKSYNEYSFIDQLIPNTQYPMTLYYRIESIDKDGKKQYSTTQQITIKPQTPNGVAIYPNPAKNVVNIECKGAKELLIIDYLGKQVYKQIATGTNLRNDVQTLNIKQLAKSIYIVQIITTKGEVKNEKLIVE